VTVGSCKAAFITLSRLSVCELRENWPDEQIRRDRLHFQECEKVHRLHGRNSGKGQPRWVLEDGQAKNTVEKPTDYAAPCYSRFDIHTFASSAENSGLHCAAGRRKKNIMPTHKDSNKSRRKRETKTIRVSARVTASLYRQIEAIALEKDRTVASVARHLKSVGLEHLENMRSPLLRAAPHIPLRESNFFRSHREEW